MVGQKEGRSVSWLWLHNALGWKHVYFLSMGIGENGIDGKLPNTISNILLSDGGDNDIDSIDKYSKYLEEKRSDDEESEVNSMMANASHISYLTSLISVKSYNSSQGTVTGRGVGGEQNGNMTYSHYLHFYYEKHLIITELISIYCGSLFGWKEPWIVQSPQKVLRNLKMYQKTSPLFNFDANLHFFS